MILASLALYLPVFAPSFASGTVEQGESYLKRAEERLYRWPAPGVVVSFEARTDVLVPMIARMKSDLARQPDAEVSRLAAALEQLTVHGTLDTATGKVTTDVRVDYSSSEPRTTAAIDEIKRRVTLTITGCFQGLPLHDPSLLHAGSKVTACEERANSILVTLSGGQGTAVTRLSLGRSSLLPERVETSTLVGLYRYEESFQGRFAPSQLDLTSRGGQESHARYTYQKQGEILFPATVKVSMGDQAATITFDSLSVKKRPPG